MGDSNNSNQSFGIPELKGVGFFSLQPWRIVYTRIEKHVTQNATRYHQLQRHVHAGHVCTHMPELGWLE